MRNKSRVHRPHSSRRDPGATKSGRRVPQSDGTRKLMIQLGSGDALPVHVSWANEAYHWKMAH